ncbi:MULTISPECIES: luciferase domain-containing protein [unclassified Streptomyces]|uniref:luciferase domain-containing protein n=1 Tax=unclassified Streptomyces TaxID=2593676 RepID=UPI00296737E2|nr:luciferase family protein [Streptomyces sp. SCL15-4]
MTLASRALAQLATWPDLRQTVPSCGLGQAVSSAHGEIVHFHSERDVDLLLTDRAVRRFTKDLKNSGAIRIVRGSPWVTLRLDAASDVDLLLTLVSVALQAPQTWPDPAGRPAAGCNDQRGAGFVKADLGRI